MPAASLACLLLLLRRSAAESPTLPPQGASVPCPEPLRMTPRAKRGLEPGGGGLGRDPARLLSHSMVLEGYCPAPSGPTFLSK